MKLASYRGTRAFPNGIANVLIRLRLRGDYSHSELIFEPSDLVDQYLPDKNSSETSEGLWAFSSVAAEKLPEYSKVRGSEIGGVRFKRIKFDSVNWDIVDIPKEINATEVIRNAKELEGSKYDWFLIGSFLAWFIKGKIRRFTCNEAVAEVLGIKEAWRLDPCSLHNVLNFISRIKYKDRE